MKNIKVSIVVPFYNTEQYARVCLDSLVSQSLKEIEIICVNDASPDGVLSVLREYEEKYREKIIVIDSQVNLKQGGARNLGIKAARGEYIAFVDSDDYVDFTMYEKLYSKAVSGDFDIIFSGVYEKWQDGSLIYKTSYADNFQGLKGIDLNKKVIKLASPAPFYLLSRRSLWVNHNISFAEGIYFEDIYCSTLLFSYIKSVSFIDEPLYYYYQRPNSTMHSTSFEIFIRDHYKSCCLLLEEFKKRGLYEKFSEELNYRLLRYIGWVPILELLLVKTKVTYADLLKIRENLESLLGKHYLNNKHIKSDKMRFIILLLHKNFMPLIFMGINFLKPFRSLLIEIKRNAGKRKISSERDKS